MGGAISKLQPQWTTSSQRMEVFTKWKLTYSIEKGSINYVDTTNKHIFEIQKDV